MKRTTTFMEAPGFISDIEAILNQMCVILHELDRQPMSKADIASVDAMIAMLNVTSDACSRVVCDLESSFQPNGASSAA